MSATTVAPSTRIGHVAPQALGTVVITGGSSGLGAATAAAVQAGGGTPLVLDRVAPESEFAYQQVDLADSAAAAAAVDAAVKAAGGQLDGIFTAAGIDSCGPLDEVSVEEWERVIRGESTRHCGRGSGGAALSAPQPRAGSDVCVHPWHQGGQRCDRVLRVEVWRRRLHSRSGCGAGGRGGRHAAHSGRHAYPLLRQPDRAIQAAA